MTPEMNQSNRPQNVCLLNMGTADLYGSTDPFHRMPKSPRPLDASPMQEIVRVDLSNYSQVRHVSKRPGWPDWANFLENYRNSPHFWATFSKAKSSTLILTKIWIGLHFERLFSKRVWSPWKRPTLNVCLHQQWKHRGPFLTSPLGANFDR
jgi:hypothetical protein